MNRSVILGVGAAALVAAVAVTWIHVRQEREFRRLLAVGDVALVRDQTSVAIEAFSGAIALKSNSMIAYLRRGDTYRRRGELPAALRDLRHAESLDPTAPQPAELLGDVNAAMERYEQSARDYRRYVSLDDRAPDVLYKLGAAYYREGDADAAIEALRKSIALDPRAAEPHYLLGVCLRDAHRVDDAVRELARAVTLNPVLTAPHEALAEMYGASGHRREQIEQLETLAALEPARPQRLVDIGLTYEHLGLGEAALETLQHAADRYPGSSVVATALGRVWLDIAEVGHDRAAVQHALAPLQQAAAHEDATSETLTLYGRALLLSGDAKTAEAVLKRAAGRGPTDPAAYLYLADAEKRLGKHRSQREATLTYATLVAR